MSTVSWISSPAHVARCEVSMSLAWVAESRSLVDELAPVVRRLSQLHASNDLEAALETGSVLLDHLYGGRAEEVLYDSPAEGSVSLRQLSQHPQVRISASYLSRALHIAAQHRLLPPSIRSALGLTQLRELLVIRDPVAKIELARRAVANGWSAAELQREIRELRPVKARRRSPGLPQAIADVQKVADRVTSDGERAFSGLDADEMDALLADFAVAMGALESMRTALQARAREQRIREEGVVPFR
jgi:hypothetical protein